MDSDLLLKRMCTVLVIITCIFILAFGMIYLVQDRMLYHNVHDKESRELLRGRPGFYEVSFTAENGKTYHGMMYRSSEETTPLIIYFGGNGEVSYRHMFARDAMDQWRFFEGYSYLFIDYEGYGLNSGRPHYLNMYEQALSVYDYAVGLPSVDSERIVVMGFSLGTGSAVYLAANRQVAGLILATPYANGYDLYNNVLPIFRGPMKLLVKQKLPSDRYAPKVKCPVLIFASRDDEVIPFASSVKLSEMFLPDMDFVALDGVGHNSIFEAKGAYDTVKVFLDEWR